MKREWIVERERERERDEGESSQPACVSRLLAAMSEGSYAVDAGQMPAIAAVTDHSNSYTAVYYVL